MSRNHLDIFDPNRDGTVLVSCHADISALQATQPEVKLCRNHGCFLLSGPDDVIRDFLAQYDIIRGPK